MPVIARGEPGRPHIALVGHLDTVRTENGPARIEGGRCFGAGAADMKAGLAVMIVARRDDSPQLATCDLTLVFYAREEGPYLENELGPVLDQRRGPSRRRPRRVPRAVGQQAPPRLLRVDPRDRHVRGQDGPQRAPVGRGERHHKARRPARSPRELAPVEHPIDGLIYRTATTVTLANGGRGRNVVPDVFTLNLNHRFAPDTSLEQAQDDVRALVGEGARLEFTDLSPARCRTPRIRS